MRLIAALWLLLAIWFSPLLPAAGPASRLTIEQAVAEALSRNLGLAAERLNVGIAETRILTARLRPNPVLSGGGDHLDLIGTRFTELNGAGPTEFNFRADLPLERAAKRHARIAVAESSRGVAELAWRNAARILALETQNAFIDALAARDALQLARQNLDSLNRIVVINRDRLRAGDLSRVEMTRSHLAALQFQNSVRQNELKLRTALNRLAALLGRTNPASLLEVEGGFRQDAAAVVAADLQERALKLRPDLLSLRRDLARASADLRLQTLTAKPDYTLGAEYRRQQGVNGKSNSLGFFMEMPLPFFNRNQGEIQRAGQEIRQAGLRVQALERSIASEIQTACEQYTAARELLQRIEGEMIGQARDVRDITEYSYRRGDASLLELLDAQRAFNETMQSYNDARAEFARALYLLDSVSGKDLNP